MLPPQTIHHVSESSAIASVRRAGNQLAHILGLDETLAEEQVVLIVRGDVRDTGPVAHNRDRRRSCRR